MTILKKYLQSILQIDLIISSICFVLLVILTMLGIVMRYVFNSPLPWLEEVQMILILWSVFFGGSVAFRQRSHIAIEILVDAAPKYYQRFIYMFVYVFSISILCFMVYQGFAYINGLAKIQRVTSVLQIPSQYIYMSFPLGSLYMLLSFIVTEGKALFTKANTQTSTQGEEK